MKTKEEIMYDDPTIVEFRTNIEGWVSLKDGRFFGKGDQGEHMARYHASTHSKCECGATMSKGWLKCKSCRHKKAMENYRALPLIEWDGKTPLCLYWDDEYFFDDDAIYDYCLINEIPNANELDLVICRPNHLREIEYEWFEDEMPEDTGIDTVAPEIYKKIQELNKEIHAHKPISWSPGKQRVTIDMEIEIQDI
jgi:hypothetical protein